MVINEDICQKIYKMAVKSLGADIYVVDQN